MSTNVQVTKQLCFQSSCMGPTDLIPERDIEELEKFHSATFAVF